MSDPDWDSFDRMQEFPFPEVALAELKRYVQSVHEFLPHISDQKIVRLRAKISAETDPVAIGEMESEVERISEDGALLLPRLVWGGVLVSTCAAYEFGVEQVLKHWQKETDHKAKFAVEKGKDFITSAEQYAEHHIHIPLLPSAHHRRVLSQLKGLRNSYVHRGSRFNTLSRDLRESIEKQENIGVTLSVVGECWVANARSAAYFLLSAENAVTDFSTVALRKCLEHPRK